MKHLLTLAFCFITFTTIDNRQITVDSTQVISVVDMSINVRWIDTDIQDAPFLTHEAFSSLISKLDRCR